MSDDADMLFERGISALRLELAGQGCPDFIVERAIDELRADYARTCGWLRVVECSARRRNPFPGFRVIQFRRELRRAH
jgi:hypothetical protein